MPQDIEDTPNPRSWVRVLCCGCSGWTAGVAAGVEGEFARAPRDGCGLAARPRRIVPLWSVMIRSTVAGLIAVDEVLFAMAPLRSAYSAAVAGPQVGRRPSRRRQWCCPNAS